MGQEDRPRGVRRQRREHLGLCKHIDIIWNWHQSCFGSLTIELVGAHQRPLAPAPRCACARPRQPRAYTRRPRLARLGEPPLRWRGHPGVEAHHHAAGRPARRTRGGRGGRRGEHRGGRIGRAVYVWRELVHGGQREGAGTGVGPAGDGAGGADAGCYDPQVALVLLRVNVDRDINGIMAFCHVPYRAIAHRVAM